MYPVVNTLTQHQMAGTNVHTQHISVRLSCTSVGSVVLGGGEAKVMLF